MLKPRRKSKSQKELEAAANAPGQRRLSFSVQVTSTAATTDIVPSDASTLKQFVGAKVLDSPLQREAAQGVAEFSTPKRRVLRRLDTGEKEPLPDLTTRDAATDACSKRCIEPDTTMMAIAATAATSLPQVVSTLKHDASSQFDVVSSDASALKQLTGRGKDSPAQIVATEGFVDHSTPQRRVLRRLGTSEREPLPPIARNVDTNACSKKCLASGATVTAKASVTSLLQDVSTLKHDASSQLDGMSSDASGLKQLAGRGVVSPTLSAATEGLATASTPKRRVLRRRATTEKEPLPAPIARDADATTKADSKRCLASDARTMASATATSLLQAAPTLKQVASSKLDAMPSDAPALKQLMGGIAGSPPPSAAAECAVDRSTPQRRVLGRMVTSEKEPLPSPIARDVATSACNKKCTALIAIPRSPLQLSERRSRSRTPPYARASAPTSMVWSTAPTSSSSTLCCLAPPLLSQLDDDDIPVSQPRRISEELLPPPLVPSQRRQHEDTLFLNRASVATPAMVLSDSPQKESNELRGRPADRTFHEVVPRWMKGSRNDWLSREERARKRWRR